MTQGVLILIIFDIMISKFTKRERVEKGGACFLLHEVSFVAQGVFIPVYFFDIMISKSHWVCGRKEKGAGAPFYVVGGSVCLRKVVGGGITVYRLGIERAKRKGASAFFCDTRRVHSCLFLIS